MMISDPTKKAIGRAYEDAVLESIFELDASTKHTVRDFARLIQSPIEWVLFGAMAGRFAARRAWREKPLIEFRSESVDWSDLQQANLGGIIGLYAQTGVDRYKADFLIAVPAKARVVGIAIECDGHDYHERTRKQARHDRCRDRVMQSKGLVVHRYTGSEIWADAPLCAKEIEAEVDRLVSGAA